MRVEIQNTPIRAGLDTVLNVTVSAGVYAAVPTTEDTDAPLRIADSALYHAKNAGRNKVSIGSTGKSP
jgi:diguanylate cyclase (GGDEF)-like protein